MGGSSKQVTGYKYFANFLLFIGNPIERLIAINFDKRGWQKGERVPFGSNGEQITIDLPNLYGENEGGVSGLVYLKTGTDTQTPVEFYQDYLESVSLPALAYPRQSYLAFKDFYLGNSGYPKEMLLWPKRIHVKNDGSEQWYDAKAEIPNGMPINEAYIAETLVGGSITLNYESSITNGTKSTTYFTEVVNINVVPHNEMSSSGVTSGNLPDNIKSEENIIVTFSKGGVAVLSGDLQYKAVSASLNITGTGVLYFEKGKSLLLENGYTSVPFKAIVNTDGLVNIYYYEMGL